MFYPKKLLSDMAELVARLAESPVFVAEVSCRLTCFCAECWREPHGRNLLTCPVSLNLLLQANQHLRCSSASF